MKRLLIALGALCLLAMPGMAEWKKLDGQKVPEFSAGEWLNTGKDTPSAASLRGKVYLIEFFATW
jgi:hypothetical protein